MERSTDQVTSKFITHLKHCYQGDRCTSHHYWIPGIPWQRTSFKLGGHESGDEMDNPLSPPQFYNTMRTPTLELPRTVEGEPMKAGGSVHLCSLLMNLEISGWLVRIGTSMMDCTWSLPRRVSSVSLHTQLFLGQCQHSCNSPLHNLQRVTERWMMPLIAFTWSQWRKRKLTFYLVPETWVYNVGIHPSACVDNPNVANVNQNIYRRW